MLTESSSIAGLCKRRQLLQQLAKGGFITNAHAALELAEKAFLHVCLEDAYSKETRGRLMGTFAEECATTYGFTREAQDEYVQVGIGIPDDDIAAFATVNGFDGNQRALAVRDALVAGGVAVDRVKLRKPESTVGTGSAEEGRRVEIRVQ